MKKESRIIFVIKVSCFCLVCLLISGILTPIFVDKKARNEIGGFPSLPKDSVDVLFLGPSSTVTSCSPMVLWKEYGFASYNIAMGGQSVPINYFNLKSALETQSPKVVVLDISYASQQDALAGQPSRLHQWLSFSHPSLVKLEAIISLTPPNEWLDYMFQLQYFHDRWEELEEEDFTGYSRVSYGSGGGANVAGLSDGIIILPEEDKAEAFISDISLEYLDKIISLCKEKDIEVLLFKPPARAYGTADSHGDGFDLQRQWNAFADYAQNQGLEYLNCMHYLDEIGVRFSSDFGDGSHGNLRDVQKVTKFIGNYLLQHYELPDHRGESAYEQWDSDCDAYYQRIENAGMTLTEEEPIRVIYSEEELFLSKTNGEKSNILCSSLENGKTFTILVGELEQDGAEDDAIQVVLWDDEKKYCAIQTELLPGMELEWSFTVPEDGNNYCLLFLQPKGLEVTANYIQIVEESDDFVME